MPTELTPGGNSAYGAYGYHTPRSLPGWANGPVAPGLGGNVPGTGPARAIDCLPGLNKCLPNGMRNPWAPYAGETYSPGSHGANMRGVHAYGAAFPGSNMGGGGISAYNGGGGMSAYGGAGGGSVIVPGGGGSMGGGGGGSMIAPRSLAGGSMVGGLGGMRADDGWDGSVGRMHNGVDPDLTSTAGALPRVAQSASAWLYAPSSPANHVRLSPQSPEVYLQPPIAPSYAHSNDHRPRRYPSMNEGCHDCDAGRSRRGSSGNRSLPPVAGEGKSPYRKLIPSSPAHGSPLRPSPDLHLSRRVSVKSHKSSISHRHCSECSA